MPTYGSLIWRIVYRMTPYRAVHRELPNSSRQLFIKPDYESLRNFKHQNFMHLSMLA